jgi:MmyB-like transcription regulator ligand binding domain
VPSRLSEPEREHLLDLARTAGPARRARRRPPAQRVRPNVIRVLDGMTEVPAFVKNGRLDVLAANLLARALYAPLFASGG